MIRTVKSQGLKTSKLRPILGFIPERWMIESPELLGRIFSTKNGLRMISWARRWLRWMFNPECFQEHSMLARSVGRSPFLTRKPMTRARESSASRARLTSGITESEGYPLPPMRISRKEAFGFALTPKLLAAFEGTPLDMEMGSVLGKIAESLEG